LNFRRNVLFTIWELFCFVKTRMFKVFRPKSKVIFLRFNAAVVKP
jgi:hypothetical protein